MSSATRSGSTGQTGAGEAASATRGGPAPASTAVAGPVTGGSPASAGVTTPPTPSVGNTPSRPLAPAAPALDGSFATGVTIGIVITAGEPPAPASGAGGVSTAAGASTGSLGIPSTCAQPDARTQHATAEHRRSSVRCARPRCSDPSTMSPSPPTRQRVQANADTPERRRTGTTGAQGNIRARTSHGLCAPRPNHVVPRNPTSIPVEGRDLIRSWPQRRLPSTARPSSSGTRDRGHVGKAHKGSAVGPLLRAGLPAYSGSPVITAAAGVPACAEARARASAGRSRLAQMGWHRRDDGAGRAACAWSGICYH